MAPLSATNLVLLQKGLHGSMRLIIKTHFAPIARISFVHALLAIVAASKWDIFQMDVKNAFLNGI